MLNHKWSWRTRSSSNNSSPADTEKSNQQLLRFCHFPPNVTPMVPYFCRTWCKPKPKSEYSKKNPWKKEGTVGNFILFLCHLFYSTIFQALYFSQYNFRRWLWAILIQIHFNPILTTLWQQGVEILWKYYDFLNSKTVSNLDILQHEWKKIQRGPKFFFRFF